MENKAGKFFLVFAATIVLLFLALVVYLAIPTTTTVPLLPNPNGYDSLVKAGKAITGNPAEFETMAEDELKTLVDDNSNALQFARAGLQQQCGVPLQFSEAYLTNHMDEISRFKALAQMFVAEGRLAELQHRLPDAASNYLEAVCLGGEVMRGGVVIDALVGGGVERLGLTRLRQLTNGLSATEYRETAQALEKLAAQRPTWDEIAQQERNWSRRTFVGFRYRLAELVMYKSMKRSQQQTSQKFMEEQRRLGQTIVDFAARTHELEKGSRPKTVSALVPDYLKAVPKDPLTGADMTLSP